MTSISELLDNIKTLVNQYIYTKEETQENFDEYVKIDMRYESGNFYIPSVVYKNDGQTDMSSDYTSTSNKASLTYDATNKYYILRNTSGSSGYGTLRFNNLTIDNNSVLSADVMIPSQNANTRIRLSIFNNNTNRGIGMNFAKLNDSSELSIRENLEYDAENYPSNNGVLISSFLSTSSISYNTWYKMELIVDENIFCANLYNSDGSLNCSLKKIIPSIIDDEDNSVGIHFGYTNNAYCYFKNVRVSTNNGNYTN